MKDLGMNGWWRSELERVLVKCVHVDPQKHLGFPLGWEKLSVWDSADGQGVG
jgi:hypothetical protein